MLNKHVLHHGLPEPASERIPLHAGPLSMLFEPDIGFLRTVRLGDQEVLRGVYAAVRDRNWGTVPPQVSGVRVERSEDSFRLTFHVECREGEIHFGWDGTLEGTAEGTVTFRMDGEARTPFLRARIGFCVLHPVRECAGRPCLVEKADGSTEAGAFPLLISPHQPFFEMRALSHEVFPGLTAEVRFQGDVFEMEDQRNWTDASFKTYCTPLALPFPVEVQAGTRISQSVTLALRGTVPEEARASSAPEEIRFALSDAAPVPLPRIGLGLPQGDELPDGPTLDRLKALRLSHLRVDLPLHSPGYREALRRAREAARSLEVPLEAALFVSDAAEAELSAFAAEVGGAWEEFACCLLFHAGEKTTGERWTSLARRLLSPSGSGPRLGGGTNAYFTELNRFRPSPGGLEDLDLVCYSVNPQAHNPDDATLVENLEGQAETVRSARAIIGGRKLALTPVTLRPRFNPNATGPEPPPPPGELPSQVDPRQMSLFGAGWTLGSLKYLAESGADRVTFYETHGWRGVMETGAGSPLPERFPSLRGAVFPLYHVLADVGEFSGGEVLPMVSSRPLEVDGLALRKGDRACLLLANLSPQPQRVRTAWPGGGTEVWIRLLDETNGERAMREPEGFRREPGRRTALSGGSFLLDLPPYAIARLDGAEGNDG
jgi:hypothetical protein